MRNYKNTNEYSSSKISDYHSTLSTEKLKYNVGTAQL